MERDSTAIALGNKISSCRKSRKLTQVQLTKMTGIKPSSISNYESGYIKPGIDKLQSIADALGKDISWFLDNNTSTEDDINDKLKQKTIDNVIPFFKNNNIEAIISYDITLADSFLELNTGNKFNTDGLFSTEMCDNSLINSGIRKGSLIVINTQRTPKSGNIVAVADIQNKNITARIYMNDGPVIHLNTNGYGNDENIITTKNDDNYQILGTVVAHISKLELFD